MSNGPNKRIQATVGVLGCGGPARWACAHRAGAGALAGAYKSGNSGDASLTAKSRQSGQCGNSSTPRLRDGGDEIVPG